MTDTGETGFKCDVRSPSWRIGWKGGRSHAASGGPVAGGWSEKWASRGMTPESGIGQVADGRHIPASPRPTVPADARIFPQVDSLGATAACGRKLGGGTMTKRTIARRSNRGCPAVPLGGRGSGVAGPVVAADRVGSSGVVGSRGIGSGGGCSR